MGKESPKISFASMGEDGAAALIKLSEESRRFSDMMRMYAMNGDDERSMPVDEELVINKDNPIIKGLASLDSAKAEAISKNIYLTAVFANRQLTKTELSELIDSNMALYKLLN